MAAAQTALRAANPVGPPPDQTEQIKWVNCLRANGYPTFPYPQGNQTNFNGTGIDPTSPAFLKGKANQTCGKQIGAPSWWTNGTGPPGDVVVSSAGIGPNGPAPGALPNRSRPVQGPAGPAGRPRCSPVAEPSPRRVAALAAVVGAVVSGVVAGGVAALSAGASPGSPASSPTGGSVATAAVVRTTLTNAVQVGGSIGYSGSYTIPAPSGASTGQLDQAEQAVAQDQQALSADEQTASAAASADRQTTSAAQANVDTAAAALSSDRAKKSKACSGHKASTAACRQDVQKVSQDQTQLTQSRQQLTTAQTSATLDHAQNQGKVGSDTTKLQGDETSLALLQSTAANPGTAYTWLPAVGQVIRQDQRVYSVSNESVPLLYGSIAAYRAFYLGMSNGADVGELTRDLIALGYGAGLSHSNHYSDATAAAVKRWQRARGVAATGEILLGQVVFEPGPIRVTSVTASVGSSIGGGGAGASGASGGGGGTVLTATGTTPIVTVDLDVTQEYLVKPGDAVSIVLPDGTSTVGGHVETVGTVATCAGWRWHRHRWRSGWRDRRSVSRAPPAPAPPAATPTRHQPCRSRSGWTAPRQGPGSTSRR